MNDVTVGQIKACIGAIKRDNQPMGKAAKGLCWAGLILGVGFATGSFLNFRISPTATVQPLRVVLSLGGFVMGTGAVTTSTLALRLDRLTESGQSRGAYLKQLSRFNTTQSDTETANAVTLAAAEKALSPADWAHLNQLLITETQP